MRLACWPFEVEGQGAAQDGAAVADDPLAPVSPAAEPPAIASPAAAPPASPALPTAPAPALAAALPPSLPLFEEARYEIRFGILGAVGELRFSARGIATAVDGSRVVHIHGSGEGGVLGLGSMQRRIESEFDAGTLGSRSWSVLRMRRGQSETEGTLDSASRGAAGSLNLERLQAGQPLARQTVTFALPTSDPLGLLWRLRTAPPPLGTTQTMQLLDGLALWRVRITTTAIGVSPPDMAAVAIRLEGELAPILYDGAPDPDRPTRRFILWLGDDVNHLPLRLEVPLGVGAVVMTLAEARKLAGADQPMVPLPGARNL